MYSTGSTTSLGKPLKHHALLYQCESQLLCCDQQEQAQAVLGGSKKDNDVRRQEILGEGAGSLAGVLCSTCSAHAADMLRDSRACDVIVKVAQGGSEGKQESVNISKQLVKDFSRATTSVV